MFGAPGSDGAQGAPMWGGGAPDGRAAPPGVDRGVPGPPPPPRMFGAPGGAPGSAPPFVGGRPAFAFPQGAQQPLQSPLYGAIPASMSGAQVPFGAAPQEGAPSPMLMPGMGQFAPNYLGGTMQPPSGTGTPPGSAGGVNPGRTSVSPRTMPGPGRPPSAPRVGGTGARRARPPRNARQNTVAPSPQMPPQGMYMRPARPGERASPADVPPGMPSPAFGGATSPSPMLGMPPPAQGTGAERPNWTPSLTLQQQQALLTRAVQVAKARDTPGYLPMHALLQMGFVFVRASQTPQVPSSGLAGDGTILRIDEAVALGVLPPHTRPAGAGGAAPGTSPSGAPGSAPHAAPGIAVPGVPVPPVAAPPAQPELPNATHAMVATLGAASGTGGTMRGDAPAGVSVPLVEGGEAPQKSAVGMPVVPFNTRLSKLPPVEESNSETYPWKPLTKEEESELVEVMRKDKTFQRVLLRQHKRSDAELRARLAQALAPRTLRWWERPANERRGGEPLRVLFPAQRRRLLEQGARGARPEVQLSAPWVQRVAEAAETLVPIRLELEYEPFRLRDTFTWNAAEDEAGLEAFAVNICEDLGLPAHVFVSLIKGAVQSQVSEHATAMALRPEGAAQNEDPRGKMDDDAQRGWSALRRGVLERADATPPAPPAAQQAADEPAPPTEPDTDGRPAAAHTSTCSDASATPSSPSTPTDDLRILIKLDILVGGLNLVDQFEWDLTSTDPYAAEKFADAYAADLGLVGEFKTAVAHAIREQVSAHQRSLLLLGYPYNRLATLDEEVRTAFLPPVDEAAAQRQRTALSEYTPQLVQLTPTDVARLERERERDMRRKRRQTKGRRGVNLPDREPQRTFRSPPVWGLQGGIPEAPASQPGVPPAGAGGAGTGLTRRAAAAAASANISTMAAMQANEAPGGTPGAEERMSAAQAHKRMRADWYDVHFRYPGGLGPLPGERVRAAPAYPPNATASAAHTLGQRSERPAAAHAHPAHPPKDPQQAAWDAAIARGARPEDLRRQQPNMHGGVWHCGNCGVPDYLAAGRRKGPAGEKTLCGPCGKYYHLHRRMMPAEYTRDAEQHLARMRAAGHAPTPPTDAAAHRAQTGGPTGEEESPPGPLFDSDSDEGETATPAAEAAPTPAPAPQEPAAPQEPPAWLLRCVENSRRQYPNDRFQVHPRARTPGEPTPDVAEWRIRCLDCPGKVYKPGPGESLTNFEIHLKNKSHRAAVARRLGEAASG